MVQTLFFRIVLSVGADIIRPLWQVLEKNVWISPAGEFLLQRCKRNQKPAGGGSRAFNNALSRRAPDPRYFYGGGIKGLCISIRRGQKTGHHSSRRPLPLYVG